MSFSAFIVRLSLVFEEEAMPADLSAEEAAIRLGGGAKAIERQHEKGRLTARERIRSEEHTSELQSR